VVADVADKGMAAALYMTTCRTLIRAYATEYTEAPELVLAEANRRILADTHGGLFITVFYGILDPAKGILTYCNAGHNPPYLFSLKDNGAQQALTRTGMPLGIIEQTSWERAVLTFESGDVLVAYTDGVTEAQNTEEGFYEEARLIEVTKANTGLTAKAMLEIMATDIQEFVGEAPQFDDLTLMVVKRV
jgi:sigma-B regulation protein RsbU (phosphoserine phosphatase)